MSTDGVSFATLFPMTLQEIDESHEALFLKMIQDYEAKDPATFARMYSRRKPWGPAEYKRFVKECATSKMDLRPKACKTSVTNYLMLDAGGQICAHGIMRFPLTEKTEIDGGNLSCDVPPSLRHRGYGSYCLALMLFEAVRAGLRRVLVTCPEEDRYARSMIEKNRGVLQDVVLSTDPERKGLSIARYWISFSN